MREMKDSGVQWIGEIPKEWNAIHLRHIADIETGNMDTQNNDPDGAYPFYVRSPIVERSNDYTFDDIEAILMAGDGVGAGRIFHLAHGKYGCHQRVYRMNSFRYAKAEYLKYYLESIFPFIMDQGSAKSTVDSVRLPMLKSFSVVVPSLAEQSNIVAYLDRRCATIDALIANQQQQIDKLKQYKQAVITEAVTRGLDPSVRMKDSGVEWIGEVPEHWRVCRKLSYQCIEGITYGIVKLFEPDDIQGIKVIRCSDVFEGHIDPSNIRTVTREVSNEYKRTILHGGEVVVNVRGSLGGCAVVPYEMSGFNIAREVAMVRLSDVYVNRFVMYFFLSSAFTRYQQAHLSGSVYVGLNIELLSSCTLPWPSKSEQQSIVAYLDTKCVQIDALIALKQQKADKLAQYKKSLIYEVVTGKQEI